jgi:cytochrome bd-type quinol oxidase subunit 2
MSMTTTGTQRPRSVTTAFRLALLSIVVGVVSGVVSLLFGGARQVDDAARTAGQSSTTVVSVAAVIAMVVLLIELLIIFKVRDGARWARVLLTVLTVLQLLGFVGSVTRLTRDADTGSGVVELVTSVVDAILGIAVLIYLYRPGSRDYFRRR